MIASILLTLLMTSNSSQRPVVVSTDHVQHLVSAVPSVEPTEEPTPAPFVVQSSQASLPPAPQGQVAVAVDRASGVETYVDTGILPSLAIQYPQSPYDDVAPELVLQSWGSDLVNITSSSYPWAAQVRVVYTDAQGNFGIGSGTMVDPYHVLTAGHCVHQGAGGTWMTSTKVYPAWDGDDDAFGNADWSNLTTFTGWTISSSADEDIALIRLDRPLGLLTGWLYLWYGIDTDFASSELFNVAGYPDNFSCYSGAPNQLFYGWGSFDTVNPSQLISSVSWNCDAAGMDGAGVYKIISTNRYLYGVQRYHSTFLNWSYVKRTTASEYNYFTGSFMPTAYPSGPDYVPMRVEVEDADAPITSGTSVGTVAYTVGNASYYYNGPTTLDVEVYLSSNDTITTSDTLLQTHSFSYVFDGLTTVDVEVPVSPVIPQSIQDGTYYLGVIITPRDGSALSRSSDASDAAEIEVDHCGTSYAVFGQGLAGSAGFVPVLYGANGGCGPGGHEVRVAGGLGGSPGILWVGFASTDLFPVLGGGHFYIDFSLSGLTIPFRLAGPAGVPGAGSLDLVGGDVAEVAPLTIYLQCGFADPGAPQGISLTNGLSMQIQ
jgi:V8-like Glu-specific endopeptidase